MKKPVRNLKTIIIGAFALLLINSCNFNETQVKQEKQIKSDHVVFDEFGTWQVKHVFDKDSLNHLYSNAKTVITLSNGEEFPFLIYRHNDNNISYLIPGWIDKVIITIDGVEFIDQQSEMHTFHGEATANLLNAMAKAKSDIQIKFYSGDDEYSGTINLKGLNTALKWIRVIK